MGKFDRYLLQQLLMLFGFFCLLLTLIFWVNRAVTLLDWLMGDGQSVATFFRLSLLSLPGVIVNLLPIAGFIAAVYATNRLSSESELVVVQAAGYSPYRMARPVIIYGLIVTAMVAMLAHVLEPLANREQEVRRVEISRDVTARLLTEGTFVHPVSGVTFYVREITPAGELIDVYLSNSRNADQRQSFTARRALIVEENNEPLLLMFDGAAQVYNLETKALAITRFESFAYGLGDWLQPADTPRWRTRTLTTAQLISRPADVLAQSQATPQEMVTEIHSRNNRAFMGLAASLLGFSALLVGGFSRFGLWRQIFLGVVIMVAIKSLDNSVAAMVERTPAKWPLLYLVNVIGVAASFGLLWLAAHPHLDLGRARRARAARMEAS
ncbi:LPS export ABC transporter permease LptF [Celeribacter arenosi]|uniref:LPS export ABC transporter permease LptF n=1 Tax=Celeribacter arenosi TaxID=792649 RepID=A0ABP7KEF8_9RHOB